MNHIKTTEMFAGIMHDVKNLVAARERHISVELQNRFETAKGWDIYSLDDKNVGLVLNSEPYATRNEAVAKAKALFGADCMKMHRR